MKKREKKKQGILELTTLLGDEIKRITNKEVYITIKLKKL